MVFSPYTLLRKIIRRGKDAFGFAPIEPDLPSYLSLFRYDSTARLLNYGPQGEEIEDNSEFRVKESRENAVASAVSSTKRTVRRPAGIHSVAKIRRPGTNREPTR